MARSRFCQMAFGLPGRVIISVVPKIYADCLLSQLFGVYLAPSMRNSSPMPGKDLSQMPSRASGVISSGVGPVPPVIKRMAGVSFAIMERT